MRRFVIRAFAPALRTVVIVLVAGGCGHSKSSEGEAPSQPEPVAEAEAGEPEMADAGPSEPETADRPEVTRDECTSQGGVVVGDIGDGAIHRADYVCESGKPPLGTITPDPGGPVAIEGEVCCPAA